MPATISARYAVKTVRIAETVGAAPYEAMGPLLYAAARTAARSSSFDMSVRPLISSFFARS